MKRTRSIYLALLAVMLSPMAAHAEVIEITGAGASNGAWEITLVDGLYEDLSALLASQEWANNETLASLFAATLGEVDSINQFGIGFGPFFVFAQPPVGHIGFSLWSDGTLGFTGVTQSNFSPVGNENTIYTFATAARVSVPEPGTLALLGLGLVGLASRRRKKV